jgi:uncharacterized protein (TIRG00374 family)
LTLREPCCYGALRMNRSLRKGLFLLLLLFLLGALLYRSRGAVRLEGFRWQLLGESVRQARLSLLLLSIATVYVCYAIRSLRWMRFSRWLGPTTFPHVYGATLEGFAAVFLLGRAGEPVRPLLIASKDRLSISGSFGIYVLERIMDASATAVIAGVALVIFPIAAQPGEDAAPFLAAARTTGITIFVGLFALVGFLVYFRFHGAGALVSRLEGWHAHPGWRARIAGLLVGFSEGLQAIRTWSDLFAVVGYTALHWLLVVYVYVWVPHSFGGAFDAIDFSGAMVLLAITMVGSTAQLPGVGGGTQLASFLVFTVIFGVEKEPAAAAAIILWLITFAASCLAGLPLLIREGWSMGELRRLARAEAEAEAVGTHATFESGAKESREPSQ